MSLKEKFFAAVGAAGTVFSAIFYVLFQLAKDQKEENQRMKEVMEEELKQQEASAELQQKVNDKYNEGKKADEESLNNAICGTTVVNVDAGIDLMHNIAAKGRSRNSL